MQGFNLQLLMMVLSVVVVVSTYGSTIEVSTTATLVEQEQLLKRSNRELSKRELKSYDQPNNSTNTSDYGFLQKGVYPWFGRTKITFFDYCNNFALSCGASLIHEDIAVTSANCIADYIKNFSTYAYTIDLYLGAINYNGSDGTKYGVKKVFYPTNYDYPNNDIAFYKLYIPTNVTPVPWNMNPAVPLDGSNVTTIGFDRNTTWPLRKVDLQTISNAQCVLDLPQNIIPNNSTCAYAPQNDTCIGDSGSPVITKDGLLYGVTSFRIDGDFCGESPIGYTRTSSQTQFMSEVICTYSDNPPTTCSKEEPETNKSCGLFKLSIFCPFTFGGIFGRFLRRIIRFSR